MGMRMRGFLLPRDVVEDFQAGAAKQNIASAALFRKVLDEYLENPKHIADAVLALIEEGKDGAGKQKL